jgi:hypothetical protein
MVNCAIACIGIRFTYSSSSKSLAYLIFTPSWTWR